MNVCSSERLESALACGTPFWDLPDWPRVPIEPHRPAPPAPQKQQ